MKITTSFLPIRMVAGQKEPVVLNVYVKNDSDESKLVSLIVKIPFSLGFNKIGLEREAVKRIGFIKPKTEKTIPIPLYGKHSIQPGEYKINIRVIEHDESRYDKTKNIYDTYTILRVISRD